MIVSNPPYIDAEDMRTLEPSVADFEPHLALYGGEDGLDFYRSIIKNYKMALKPGGYIAFEFGEDQGDDICDILRENGFTVLERTKDYHDTERAVLAQLGRKDD
jgi:release factor glutamine methyltransferase